jgi:hypothetical protein
MLRLELVDVVSSLGEMVAMAVAECRSYRNPFTTKRKQLTTELR